MKTFALRVGKTFSIAGGLVTISDVMQPIAPISVYVIAFSTIVLFALIILKLIGKLWNETLIIFSYFFAGMLILSVFLYSFQLQTKQSKDIGVIASNVKEVADLQLALNIASKDIRIIKKTVLNINEKVDFLKKEVSSNPRKELANMGMSWNADGFFDAVSQGDIGVIKLYLDGGMRLSMLKAPSGYGYNPNYILDLFAINVKNIKDILSLIHSYELFDLNGLYIEPIIADINGFYKPIEGFLNLELEAQKQNYNTNSETKVTLFIKAIWSKNKKAVDWLIDKNIDYKKQGIVTFDKSKNSYYINAITVVKEYMPEYEYLFN